MRKLTNDAMLCRTNRAALLPRFCGGSVKSLWVLLLAGTMTIVLSACGGGASGDPPQSATLSGNWQFTMASQTDGNSSDPTFSGGLKGGRR